MMHLPDIIHLLNIDHSTRNLILARYASNPTKFDNAALNAYQSDAFDYPICKHTPLDRLVIWCCLLPNVLSRYQQSNVPEHICHDTIFEVTRLAKLYHAKTGRIGLSKDQVLWLRHVYHVHIFQIGSLQFQTFRMVYLDREECEADYMKFSVEQKRRLPSGTQVVNVHIPDSADLSETAIENSFSAADAFFREVFPTFQPKAYICYSWLLYPPMDALLPKGSHIRKFATKFQIISSVSDPYGSDAVKHIYGKRYARKADYPQNTSLQRNALGNFSMLGMACGIIEIA